MSDKMQDPEGFKMLVRGCLSSALGSDPYVDTNALTARLAETWRKVESSCPEGHTYDKSHSFGRGGGGGRGGPKRELSIDAKIGFGMQADFTWRQVAAGQGKPGSRGGSSRSWLEYIAKGGKDGKVDETSRFAQQVLSEVSEGAIQPPAGQGAYDPEPLDDDTPF